MSRKKSSKPKFKFQTLSGFRDVLPEHQEFWNFVLNNIKNISEDYSYQKIDTPLLENFLLFQKNIGEKSDTILKELFVFENKARQKIVLRPEFTIPIARAYVEHSMNNWPRQPVKLWSSGPVFRGNQSATNYQQFHQFDFEIIGADESDVDSQIIAMMVELFKTMGLEVEVQINSIGCSKCRQEYVKSLKKYLQGKKICSACRNGISKNPLQILSCSEEKCKKTLAQAPQIIDSLCEECKTHFVKVLENLDDSGVVYNLNPFLVGDFKYYNRTIFKFYVRNQQGGDQVLLGGGGRYDNLIEQIGGQPTPAVGAAGIIERTILKIRENGVEIKNEIQSDVFIAQLGADAKKKCLKLFKDLRKENIKVREAFAKKGLTEQLEIAKKIKVRYALILGQKEIVDGTIIIRDMDSGIQEIINFEKIIPEIKKRLLGENGLKIYNNS